MTRLLANLLAFVRHAIRPSVGRDTTGSPAAIHFFDDCLGCGAPCGYPPAGPCENHGQPNARAA